jgi:Peptidase family S41
MAALAAACVSPAAGTEPAVVAPRQPPNRLIDQRSSEATSCPLPNTERLSEFGQLARFSKTLFYVREHHPIDVSPRARELLVKALDAVASQASEVLVERDSHRPPRWVTITVAGQQCTLDVERVDAPWSLRSTLQQALRFVEGHLVPAQSTEERLMRIEIAATNGMLSALDGRSRLLDAETYRQLRPHLPNRSSPTATDESAVRTQDSKSASGAMANTMRAAPGPTVASLRLPAFAPGVSRDVEQALATFENERPKGFVLDLRDNPGGLFDEAVKVADAFVQSGTLGSIAGKRQRKDLLANNGGHEPSGALVVLVNRRTAAGAEFVAAAIKNLGRGVVLGEPTAGAASIQITFEIQETRLRRPSSDRDVVQDVLDGVKPSAPQPEPYGEPLGLVLTTGRLLAAGGAEIEGTGVRPDLQPAWPVGQQVPPEEDCLLQFAQALVVQARDPQRPTLLSTANALAGQMMCPPAKLPRL